MNFIKKCFKNFISSKSQWQWNRLEVSNANSCLHVQFAPKIHGWHRHSLKQPPSCHRPCQRQFAPGGRILLKKFENFSFLKFSTKIFNIYKFLFLFKKKHKKYTNL